MHGHMKHAAAAGEWFTPRAVRQGAAEGAGLS